MQLGHLTNAEANKIRVNVFVNSILLGWDNVQKEDGTNISFSTQNAVELMTALPDLFDDLEKQAQELSLFVEDAQETEAKN
jgi:hypothetical protein